MPDSPQPTTCASCRADLSTVAYVVDKKGRGLCKPCVAKLKAKQKAKADADARANAAGEGDVMGLLLADSAASTKTPCPECQAYITPESVVCIHCGYNIASGKQMKTRFIAAPKEKEGKKQGGGGSGKSIEVPPWAIYGGLAAIYGGLGALSYDSETMFAILWLAILVFGLISLIWAVIAAFQDGNSIWGFVGLSSILCAFSSLAFLIYVLFINDRAHIKGLYLVNFIANIAFLIIAQQTGHLEEMMGE